MTFSWINLTEKYSLWVILFNFTNVGKRVFLLGSNRTQFNSVAQSCPTLCDPVNCSTPGLPVHRHLLEFTQTHVHWVSDTIQPSHPLLSPSPPAPNSLPASETFPMSQLFAWGGQSTGVSALASFLPKKSQGWSHIHTHTHTHTHIYIYIYFTFFFHYGLLQDIEYSSLCYTVGPCLFYI